MTHLNKSSKLTGVLLTVALFVLTTSTAFAGSNSLKKGKASRIVGVWDVAVTVFDCETDTRLFSFPAIHKYELGGTGQIEPAGSSPANPLHLMVWEYLGKGQYSASIKFFRYDETGVVGTTVISNVLGLNKSGSEFDGSGIVEFFDLNGNKVGVAGCPEISGTRFNG